MKAWQKNIRQVEPYVPGEQPKFDNMIKINTNENPYPPAPGVERILKTFQTTELSLYPDFNAEDLVEELARFYEVKKEQIFVGVGSDDVLATAFLTFFNSEKPILFPDLTYSFYDVWAELYRIPYERPKVDENFRIKKEDYYKENGGVVIANPNAPTTVYMGLDEIEDIVRHNLDVVVIIDEAYIDFGGKSAIELIDKYDNLLVVQTFSKSRSMAGARIGYCIGSEALIQAINQIKFSINSYTMNALTLAIGVEAVKDVTYFKECVNKIITTRDWVIKELRELGFVCPDSKTNFLFLTHGEIVAKELFEYLRTKNIFVRYFGTPRLQNYLRVTIGTDEQMRKVVDEIKAFMSNTIE